MILNGLVSFVSIEMTEFEGVGNVRLVCGWL